MPSWNFPIFHPGSVKAKVKTYEIDWKFNVTCEPAKKVVRLCVTSAPRCAYIYVWEEGNTSGIRL